ncbi:MAG: hypothetical protein GY757_48520, partial [bacterium]|nr:hypothetical protein [bacterium]
RNFTIFWNEKSGINIKIINTGSYINKEPVKKKFADIELGGFFFLNWFFSRFCGRFLRV